MSRLQIRQTSAPICGQLAVPVSKYHLHRALIFGSLADGETTIHGRSEAMHIRDTLRSLSDLGVTITHTGDGYRVSGGNTYHPTRSRVRVGSSGSTLQFLLGLGALSTSGATVYDGVQALRNRPIGPLLAALAAIGIETKAEQSRLPVTVFPGQPTGGEVTIQGVLSQWISGLLIVAPFATTPTTIHVQDPFNERTYVRLTTSMLKDFGIDVQTSVDERTYIIPPRQRYRPATVNVDADLSSAAFPLVFGALHEGTIRLTGIQGPGTHPEGRILDVLQQMEIDLHFESDSVVVTNSGRRPRAVEIDMKDIPDLIPALSTLCSLSKGRSVLKNIGPGRLKESDRVRAMVQLRKMGARIEEDKDALIIEGVERLHAADISSYNDHRVLMSFAIAGSVASGETSLTFPNAYKISYPDYLADMAALGMNWHMAGNRSTKKVATGRTEELSLIGVR
jgi:3-phosphoshikimate 1-carboxyvinyltransferase